MHRSSILVGAAQALATLAFASPALAADLGGPALFAPPAPIVPFTWTGAYAGAALGADVGAASTSRINGNDAVRQIETQIGVRPAGGVIHGTGFSGGGQIGYNYEVSPYGTLGGLNSLAGFDRGGVVVGVEADIASAGVNGNASYTSDRQSLFTTHTDYLGTVRGRIGYAFGTVLVYGSGGFAYGGVGNSTSFLNPVGLQTYHGSQDVVGTGYAFGGGVEVALPATTFVHLPGDGAFTLRVDYLHYELGTGSYAVTNNFGLDAGYTQGTRASGNLVRAGLNYKFGTFGAPAAPVVARY